MVARRGVDTTSPTRNTSVAPAMPVLVSPVAPPAPLIAPDELEAVLVAIDDRLDAEADQDRRAVLCRGRARLERQLAQVLSA
jgi:hypothetical protein